MTEELNVHSKISFTYYKQSAELKGNKYHLCHIATLRPDLEVLLGHACGGGGTQPYLCGAARSWHCTLKLDRLVYVWVVAILMC